MSDPSLDIALGAPDIRAFKAKMNEAADHVGTVSGKIKNQFLDIDKSIQQNLMRTVSQFALGMVSELAIAVGQFKILSDAIASARDQLKEMVAISEKSQNVGVSTQFFQAFNAEARKFKVTTDDLGAALASAFKATKDKSPVDINKWETGEERITAVEKALRVYNATVAKAAGQQLQGLVLFRDAKTQEDKIQAVLKAMIQLDQIGQHAASLDLGEKMFGSKFVDKIRQGRTSAESMLTTIQTARGDADGIFSETLVQRAKDMDDKLKLAHQRLSTALKPAWDDLAGVLLTVKDYWGDTVNLIAKAVELSNQIKIPGFSTNTLQDKKDALAALDKRLAGEDSGGVVNSAYDALSKYIPGLANYTRDQLKQRRYELQGEIANDEKAFQGPNLPAAPSRGTGAAPTKKATDDTDKLQSSIDGIEKRTAALNAEAAAVDQGTVARERSKIAAQLETVAMQANAAAGKGNNVVTDEQRRHINEVADAYGKAAEAMQKAKIASDIKRGAQTALLSSEDVQIANQLRNIYPDVATALSSVEASALRGNEALRSIGNSIESGLTSNIVDASMRVKSLGDAFTAFGQVAQRAIMEAVVKLALVKPLMSGLSGLFGFASGGVVDGGSSSNPLPGLDASDYGPGYAGGGQISGPGTGTSDSIVARVSDGEFIVNADATKRYLPVLHAINTNRIPKFADGGRVGSPANDNSFAANDNRVSIAPQIAVSVQGSPGMTSADHEKMGETVGKAAMNHVKRMIGEELFRQRKQGGILSR